MHYRAEMLQVLLDADLYEAGWLGGDIFPPTPRQVAMTALSSSLLKKYHNDERDPQREQAALALFLECNTKCQSFGTIVPRTLQQELVLGETKSLIWDFFNPGDSWIKLAETSDRSLVERRHPYLLNLTTIKRGFGIGPGASIGARETDMYSKLSLSPLTHTDQRLPVLFRHAISGEQLWTSVEVARSKEFGSEMVLGSRLSFVPKNRKICRTICTEPLLNMIFQKGIGNAIEARLREVYKIDLSSQPSVNRRLAQVGAATGRFGTIDLSSASDTISLSLLQQILPPEPFNWLMLTRSPTTTLPDGRVIELHMISSMGNGFTFPLQTLIFSALVQACYRVAGIKCYMNTLGRDGNYAVFGDDIIVDSRVYSLVVEMLHLFGFTVNLNKSFNEGYFRESCGEDFYLTTNVRGVYIQTLKNVQDSYSAINRLIRWSSKHGVLLRRAVSFLRSGCRFIGVPYDEADDAGIKIPLSLLRNRKSNANGAVYYLAYRRVPRTVRIPSNVAAKGDFKGLPRWRYNPDGLLQAAVAGYIRSGLITLRPRSSRDEKAVIRRFVCPGWDERIVACGESRTFAEDWKILCELNLVS